MSEELTTAEIVPNEPTGEAHPDVREPSEEQPEAAPESEAIPEEPATAGSEAGPATEPLISLARVGAGGFVYVTFPLGRQLLAWQQGQPAEDFTIPLRWRTATERRLR